MTAPGRALFSAPPAPSIGNNFNVDVGVVDKKESCWAQKHWPYLTCIPVECGDTPSAEYKERTACCKSLPNEKCEAPPRNMLGCRRVLASEDMCSVIVLKLQVYYLMTKNHAVAKNA